MPTRLTHFTWVILLLGLLLAACASVSKTYLASTTTNVPTNHSTSDLLSTKQPATQPTESCTPNLNPVVTPTATYEISLSATNEITETPSIAFTSTPISQTGSITTTANSTSPNLQINQLKMFSKNAGWALSADHNIFRTSEGIQTWRNVTPPYPENNSGTVAYFLDSDTAFLVTGQIVTSPEEVKNQIVPWRTTDGGATWKTGETLSFTSAGPFFPVQFYFLDKKHGWLLSSEALGMSQYQADILETTDGGSHYEIIYQTLSGHPNEPGGLFADGKLPFGSQILAFLTDLNGFATNAYEELVTSKDGGRTWSALELEQPDNYPHTNFPVNVILPPLFSSDKDGVLPVRVYDRTQIDTPPGTIFHGLPLAQYLYYTHDAGQTWLPLPSPLKIGTISFLNPQVSWFLGKDDPSPFAKTQLYASADGGTTWSSIQKDAPLPLGAEIQFLDEQIGFAFNPFTGKQPNPYQELDARASAEAYLFSSNDGGHTWVQVEPKPAP